MIIGENQPRTTPNDSSMKITCKDKNELWGTSYHLTDNTPNLSDNKISYILNLSVTSFLMS